MMRLACVPFPAPGGPSSTTGPTSREVSCTIGLTKASRAQSPRRPAEVQPPNLPSASAANASAARRKSVIVAHDQLRLNLLDRIHRHAHDDQQRCSAKIKCHAQTIGHPVRKHFEESSDRSVKMVEVNPGDHPFGDKRNNDQ